MQSVEIEGLDRILTRWDALLKEFPDVKAELLENLGEQFLADVQNRIGGEGKVKGWQARYKGSKNGYLAVRPKSREYQVTKGGKQYAAGYVTNAIESGHRNRRPQPTGKDGYFYRPRITTAATPGRHFYAALRSRAEQVGAAELARLADEIARRLEGGA